MREAIFFADKSVLIINPTGFFGKELVQKILKTKAHRVAIFCQDIRDLIKLKNYEFDGEVGKLRFFLGDIRDKIRLARALDGVDIVLLNDLYSNRELMDYNPTEVTQDYIYSYENLINTSIDNGVNYVFSILHGDYLNQTDFYSMAKQCSEKLMVSANGLSSFHRTKFSVLRVGDIFNSLELELCILLEKNNNDSFVSYINKNKKSQSKGCVTEELIENIFECLYQLVGGEIFIPKYRSYSLQDFIEVKTGNKIIGNIQEKEFKLYLEDEVENIVVVDKYMVVLPLSCMWWNRERFEKSFSEKKIMKFNAESPFHEKLERNEISGLVGCGR